MTSQWKLSLGGVWLIASLSAVILPIFLPSYGDRFGESPVAISAVSMFFLSFPSSVFAIPLMFMVAVSFDFMSPLFVTYMNVLVLFSVGVLQWFWIWPRLVERHQSMQCLGLSDASGNTRLFMRDTESYTSWVDADGATPLERAVDDSSEERLSPS